MYPTENAFANPGAASVSIARQAIVDKNQAVVGYELFNRSVQKGEHTASSDAQMLFNLLSMAESETLVGKALLFVNCTLDSLAAGHVDLIAPEHSVLQIPAVPLSQIDQIQLRLPTLRALHARGFRLAFDYSVLTQPYAEWLPLAAYIKFDTVVLKSATMHSFIRLAQTKTPALLVAEKVSSQAQYLQLKELGVELFQGDWFARATMVEGQSMRPGQATILQLINLVRKQASTAEIEEVLKRDPTLSFNLLRFINSAGFGLRTEVSSFKHAVMLLGLQRLFKWAALLLTTSTLSGAAPAIGTTAVIRGRLMELLAAEALSADDCDHAFVVGIFSLLDNMLGMPLETALSNLTLPDSVTQALLHRSGPLAHYLTLTLACESGDDEAFAQSAQALQLTEKQINWAHLQALAWAETLGET
ncbi:MAG: HDOD domain-containing protein [Rhodoferax sp.]|uniref:EAL and HDOD domain-containing protein n=1 Tax=Rhodoferax sp. TaxID=50421 RepID=UPI002ACEC5E5|nr:HDOD domain-containing protein [Rhodoferax sp.]MDZ7892841.1 HDOD domain-containing protein [Rhodoferax sp.]